QKTWALDRGYDEITWTFDPLVRRNGKLNITKLGVQVHDYFPDFYGDLPDALNAGDPTDRCMARWALKGTHVAETNSEGIPVALENVGGNPKENAHSEKNVHKVLCYLPEDIIEIRSKDPIISLKWRMALRNQLHPRLSSGWNISGFTIDGAYILSAPGKG
ncbi:MAG: hypothetical protein NTY21_00890, partial [Actinobacteria bacterium]|nr:hypothetical protein [Actinomycetota bacterium]